MTNLKSILKNDIDRTIDGVIKADDKAHIRMEVEEYVLTREVLKHLNKLISGYKESIDCHKRGETYPFNGVWISGYFGSGKSHLLKILSYVLENETIEGVSLAELFLPKIEDTLFRADLQNVLKVHSQSILFNIDNEAIATPKESDSALLYIFESVFNRHCGYFPTNRGIAEFEQHLDEQGLYQTFKDDYQRIVGRSWEERRKAAFGLGRKELIKVLTESQRMNETEASDLIDHYKSGSDLSIDSFSGRVKNWLDSHESPDFRLNFFIDEVGQFISGKTRLMLNLQTLAETLGMVCEGRVWIFVTSQEDLKSVVGLTNKQQVQDFSKINARYHFKIALNSADVQEVIQKRLLDKTPEGEAALSNLYMKEQESFRTLFRMDDGGVQIQFKSKEEFTLSYPFQAYQYNLLQQCLISLSEHSAFRGQHISQGERSMLEIFQDVSKQLKDTALFNWATFDLMFEGLRQTLNSGLIGAINTAERHLESSPMAIRLLKILLMVKYVRTFKATQSHLKILLIQVTTQDLVDLDRKIGEALSQLEYQTYIQRNGAEYSYLTNEEKDIENEIKQVDISHDGIRKILSDMAFADILKLSNKIRDPELKEDYAYMRMIDTSRMSNPTDLCIHLVSAEHPNYEERSLLASQSMGKKEMTVILPADKTFQNDLRLYYQTDLYCRQQQGHDQTVLKQNIIASKQQLNTERKDQLRRKLTKMLGAAEIVLMGTDTRINSSDPQSRILEGFQKLLKLSYPKLRYLGPYHYTEADLKKILYPGDDTSLYGGDAVPMDEAEKELFNSLERKISMRDIPSLKTLMDEYSTGQCGWYPMAILSILAKLYTREKIEFSQGNAIKNRDEVFSLFSSNRDYDQVRVRTLQDVSQQDIDSLRALHMDFYHTPLHGTTPRECSIAFKESLFETYQQAQGWLNAESSTMRFLKDFPIETLKEYSQHDKDWYLSVLPSQSEKLRTFFTEEIDPLSAFMKSNQRELWKDLQEFVLTHRGNLIDLGRNAELMDLEALLEQVPYKKGILRALKKSVDNQKTDLEESIRKTKTESTNYLLKMQDDLMVGEPFQQLQPSDKQRVILPFKTLLESIDNQEQLSIIRDTTRTRGTETLQKVQEEIHRILNPAKKILFASDKEKKVAFAKMTLETEEDVLAYSESLKEQYLELIRQEKRITL